MPHLYLRGCRKRDREAIEITGGNLLQPSGRTLQDLPSRPRAGDQAHRNDPHGGPDAREDQFGDGSTGPGNCADEKSNPQYPKQAGYSQEAARFFHSYTRERTDAADAKFALGAGKLNRNTQTV